VIPGPYSPGISPVPQEGKGVNGKGNTGYKVKGWERRVGREGQKKCKKRRKRRDSIWPL